jgi:uncharacterized protein
MTTDTLLARRLSVALTVNDLARSKRFYTEGLGFAVEQEMNGDDGKVQGLMLKAGEASVGLSQDNFAKGRDRLKGVGLSFYLETDQEIAAIARRARNAGLALDGDPAPLPWGPMAFGVSDLDGFRIIISNVS